MKKFFVLAIMAIVSMAAMAQDEYKNWTVKFDVAGDLITRKVPKKNDKKLGFELGMDYNINKTISVGVASGLVYHINTQKGYHTKLIPILADVTFNIRNSSRFTPFVQLRGGYCISTKKEGTVNNKTLDLANYTTFEVEPGVAFKISDTFDVRAGVMYKRYMKGEGYGFNQHVFGGKIGVALNF